MHSQRWRVEELADHTGLTVDTIRFYQKRRLLPPPERQGRIAWYSDEHLRRLERIRQLQEEGLSLAVIGRLLDADPSSADSLLAAAVAGREAADEALAYPVEELAARTGVAPEVIEALATAGLIDKDPSGRVPAGDADLVAAGLTLLEVGLPLDDLLRLARRHDEATKRIADEAVEMFDRHVRQPILGGPGTTEDKAARLVDAFDTLFPAVTDLVSRHFGRVLLERAGDALRATADAPAEERSA